MLGVVENPLLAATSGLAAGIAGKGSTCGLVSGGALGIALAYDQHMFTADTDAERAIVQLVRDYVEWFEVSYGSTRCDELS
ncbi:MAG: C_GCAxxG_C_C family protein, partial [Bacteroidales bacterium]|nr:C_GCAxxG_C_C family protein [Bacteroidales bacterium]